MFAKLFAFIALLALVAADVVPLEAYGYGASELIETVDVTGDAGVLRLIVKKGTGVVAKKGSQISAHYDGKLLSDGKQFDSVRALSLAFSVAISAPHKLAPPYSSAVQEAQPAL